MRYQINSKKFGLCEFIKAGEYIKLYAGSGEWKQIFKGGDFFGSAVRCADDNFEAECRKWHQQRLKLTTRVTGCAAVCAIRVDPLVMRFFKEMT